MRRLVMNSEKFLKKDELVVGKLYIIKDGRLSIYLGKDTWDRFIFYHIGSVLFTNINWSNFTLAHHDTQVNYLIKLSKEVLSSELEIEQLQALKGIPKIHSTFPYFSFCEKVNMWTNNNKHVLDGKIVLKTETAKKYNGIYVRTKDLIPGELYYTGGLWRSLYLYLGRSSSGGYCWRFVSNVDYLVSNDFAYYRHGMEITKQNKKVKRIADAVNDPNVYICSEHQKLIDTNWKADLTGFELP